MRENTNQVLDWLALSEGGYVNHPADPGGATMRGVTQRVWDGWRRLRGLPVVDIRQVTEEDARAIFTRQYLAPVMFDDLPSGLDYCQADFAVNSGPQRATRVLQRVLRDLGHEIAVDGHMGLVTLGAIRREANTPLIISAVCNRRMAFLKRLKTWRTFERGWTRRVMGEEWGVQAADTGVIDRAVRMAKALPQRSRPKPAIGRATGGWSLSGWLAETFGASA